MPEGEAGGRSWRRPAIVAIKAVHSIIFIANSAAILHICWAGLLDRPSRLTRVALALASIESTVFVLNRGRCPLTQVVERLGAKDGRVSDIFLPRWFADRIPWLCTPPLLVGCSPCSRDDAEGPPRTGRPSSLEYR
jgi:hypothetical protein